MGRHGHRLEGYIDLAGANRAVRTSGVGHDKHPFLDLGEGCVMLEVSRSLPVSDTAVAFAASYFQRLLALPGASATASWARQLGYFRDSPPQPVTPPQHGEGCGEGFESDAENAPPSPAPTMSMPWPDKVPLDMRQKAGALGMLYSVCVMIATKNCDSANVFMHIDWRSRLPLMLRATTGICCPATRLLNLEAKVLRLLDWRLGRLYRPALNELRTSVRTDTTDFSRTDIIDLSDFSHTDEPPPQRRRLR